jgi:3-deoxy-D-manno-octulosonic-acid transferase
MSISKSKYHEALPLDLNFLAAKFMNCIRLVVCFVLETPIGFFWPHSPNSGSQYSLVRAAAPIFTVSTSTLPAFIRCNGTRADREGRIRKSEGDR